ncbi:condensin-2 complex subunit H2 isoform X1 [Octopus bimaculoides]|uniref:condensin-2 complex subunit H2 isoform X1 n=1 Tax=Octopus bimaculoides TaxID=37653 RepID=UPI00071C322D|nr:condensin-2 complex subunit H2 isoform X1 [Octopus bimaculoides]|eukprot:XP_014786783.1 PREDICTED: condensin-2 complex subunit H2-like isoform X1 [Octopus bimaculoides]
MVLEDDGRFNFMLQPIRDLTKNWDVDIASHLEDYLEELENVAITFDGGRTMNFAEAALLIQGSTCVYSRKVEYLYALVYEVLDLLVNKRRNKQSNNKDNNAADDPDVTFGGDDEELLPLDDIETSNVTMKEKNDKEIGTIPRRPMSMVPLGEEEKGNDPLLSKTGELLGNRNDFRLNTSQVNYDSCLLLEASAHFLSGLPNSTNKETTASSHVPTTVIRENTESDNIIENYDNPEIDDSMDDIPPPEVSTKAVEEEDTAKRSSERLQERANKIKERMAKDKEKVCSVDPWLCQDPYEQKSKTEKPFKKGKTFRIPEIVDDKKQKSKKRKKEPITEEKPEINLEPIEDFVANTLFSYKHKLQKNLRDSCLPEFERMCWTKLSERQARRKTETKAMETILEQKILDGENLEDGFEIGADLNTASGGDDDDNDDNIVGPVLNLQDDLFDIEDDSPITEESKRGEPVSSYEHLVQKHIEDFYIGAQKYAQVTELSKRIAEWEEKIIPKLQEEEQHGPFDIHEYGTTIINSLQLGNKFPLAKLMSGKPTYEIGRLFLSTLMLANTGNVELSCTGVLEDAMDKAEVTLIRRSQHFEELEQYVAPSLVHKDK